jgi:pimeloyl-ACP methyl ester carboxylesterase
MAGVRMRIALGVLAAFTAVLAVPALAPAAVQWRSCRATTGAQCGTLRVPLDRSGAMPGTVGLKLARLPADGARPTLVYLSGGPGGAGIEEMLAVIPLTPFLLDSYRVVGFDQRGTGGSGLLRCTALERDPRLRSVRAGEDCARRIGEKRRLYTTPDSVEDLEAIRAELGVERLTLFGISYGTELALAYARAHPDHVERLILDSTVDPDDRDPFGLAGFRAMGPSLAALCPARCRGVTRGRPIDLVARLAARLRGRSVRGIAYDRRGRGHRERIGPTAIADLLYDSDYNPPLRAALPAALRAALRGDRAPLARLLAEGGKLADLPSPRSFSSARYATVCEETPLPWDASTPVGERLAEAQRRAAALGPAAFFPFDLRTAAADEIGLCLHWPGVPSGRVPAPEAPYPAVPTLLLQGGEDLRTPPEGSADVASKISGATRVTVPGVGHAVVGGDPSGCGIRRLRSFVAGRPAAGDCRRVGTGVAAVALPPRTLRGVAPVRSLGRGRVARTAAAVGVTVDDLVFSLSPAFLAYSGGGLRGGSFALRRGHVAVRRFSAIRGMWITGAARNGVLRLRVGGRSAARGHVVMRSGGRLRGRLGGRSFRVRLPGYGRSSLARTATAAGGAAAARAPGAWSAAAGALAPWAAAARASHPRGAAFDAAFRAPLVAKSSRSRLVPSPPR